MGLNSKPKSFNLQIFLFIPKCGRRHLARLVIVDLHPADAFIYFLKVFNSARRQHLDIAVEPDAGFQHSKP
jgi:hypothetical protein